MSHDLRVAGHAVHHMPETLPIGKDNTLEAAQPQVELPRLVTPRFLTEQYLKRISQQARSQGQAAVPHPIEKDAPGASGLQACKGTTGVHVRSVERAVLRHSAGTLSLQETRGAHVTSVDRAVRDQQEELRHSAPNISEELQEVVVSVTEEQTVAVTSSSGRLHLGYGAERPRPGTLSGLAGGVFPETVGGFTEELPPGSLSGLAGGVFPESVGGFTEELPPGSLSGLAGGVFPEPTSGFADRLPPGTWIGPAEGVSPKTLSSLAEGLTPGTLSGFAEQAPPEPTSGFADRLPPGTSSGPADGVSPETLSGPAEGSSPSKTLSGVGEGLPRGTSSGLPGEVEAGHGCVRQPLRNDLGQAEDADLSSSSPAAKLRWHPCFCFLFLGGGGLGIDQVLRVCCLSMQHGRLHAHPQTYVCICTHGCPVTV
jgi:hypothetical protein